MKNLFVICLLFFNIPFLAYPQSNKGKVITDTIYSKNLENDFGENPNRAVSRYIFLQATMIANNAIQ